MKNAPYLFALTCLTFFLAACGPQQFAAQPTDEPCLPSDLVAPVNEDPGTDYEIILDEDHIFDWSYSSCEPEGWRVELVPHTPETYNQYPLTELQFGLPVPAQTSWVFDEPLQPATAYEWHVAAFIGGVIGDYSNTTIFWTGPICEADALTAPIQTSPADEGILEFGEGPLMWEYVGDCVPEFTNVELSTNPGFGGENLTEGFGPPRFLTYPQEMLENCTEYFWRLRNETSEAQGPWSQVWSFTTDFDGDCQQSPAPLGPPMGLATRDLNCRAGDATAFNETGFFPADNTSEILGRNSAGTWYVVPLRLAGGNCWVSAEYVQLLDDYDPQLLPVIASPALPTATATLTPEPRSTATVGSTQ